MPVAVQCGSFCLSQDEVDGLWRAVREQQEIRDDVVTVRCVSQAEIRALNKRYRGKDKSTNVLTFSYEGEHDVALCLTVARGEAIAQSEDERDYVAWLVVHAFLHIAGLDHEANTEAAQKMSRAERKILVSRGFRVSGR